MNFKNKQLMADMMIAIVAILWGTSYYLTSVALKEVDPITLNSYRFILAFFIAYIIFYKKIKKPSKETIIGAALIGAVLTAVYICSTFGLKYTSVSNAGFLSCLGVIFIPIILRIFFKEKPERKLFIVIPLAVLGIGLLVLTENFVPRIGDILCISCSLLCAIMSILVEKKVQRKDVDALSLGVFQLGFTGVFTLILNVFIEKPKLPTSMNVWAAIIFLVIFCTGLSFILQTIAQQHTNAAHVGVLYMLEPVAAGIFANIFVGEVLEARGYIGAIILIGSMVFLEIDIKALRKK